MIIEIAKLSQDGSHFSGEEPAHIIGVSDEHKIRATHPVHYELSAQLVSHQLVVQGQVSTILELECIRCMGFFSTTVEDSSFLRAYEIPEETEYVDITGDLREAVLLRIPSFPVCSANCGGLCPYCGKDLNKETCDCRSPELANRWQGLDDLKVRDDQEDER